MNSLIPKLFIDIDGKPILAYTLDAFQNNDSIDEIHVVTLKDYIEEVKGYKDKYSLDKLKNVIVGGKTVLLSIYLGLKSLNCDPCDIVIIHDGIRPLVSNDIITDSIKSAHEFSSGVSALPYNEQLFILSENDKHWTSKYIPRLNIMRALTPQAYKFSMIMSAYDKGFEFGIGIKEGSYANTLLVDIGETLHFSKGSELNIKLTTQEDLKLFKYILSARKKIEGELKND